MFEENETEIYVAPKSRILRVFEMISAIFLDLPLNLHYKLSNL